MRANPKGYIAILIVFSILMSRQETSAQSAPDDLMNYVVQSLCLDPAGNILPLTPIDAECIRRRPQLWTDEAAYRKHDWPNKSGDVGHPYGYQASDSVLLPGRQPRSVQTFDFGGDGRLFGKFDAGNGDGGQVLVFVKDWASLVMTEDGTGGVQWFIGRGCKQGARSTERFLSWLVFRKDLNADWQSHVAQLNIAKQPGACPDRWNAAYTRYRSDRLELAFNITERGTVVRSARPQLDAIVSEHYGGADIATADHLERFYYARDLGLVRWERWANGNLRQTEAVRSDHRAFLQTDRCARVERYGAPERGWLLVDCRTWTNLIKQDGKWSVGSFGWPSALDSGFEPHDQR